MNTTLPVCAPLITPAEVDDAVAALQAPGVRRRSLGVVDLKLRPGPEPDPLTRRALAAIGGETLHIVVLALAVVVMVRVALLMPTLSDRPTLTVGIGVVAGAGASPVAAIVGFALAWARWGHLANPRPGVPATSGYAVVVARSSVPAPPLAEGLSRPAVPGQAGWPRLQEHLQARRREVVAELRDALYAAKAVGASITSAGTDAKDAVGWSSSRRTTGRNHPGRSTADSFRQGATHPV